jgi:hypothetical protein
VIVIEDNAAFRLVVDFAPSGEPILHCKILKWTHGAYKNLLGVLCQVTMQLKGPVYAPRVSDKQEKFLKLMGFSPTGALLQTTVGEIYPLFKFEVH